MRFHRFFKGEFFAFSKSEFRGFIVLLLILAGLTGIRYHQIKDVGRIGMQVSPLPESLVVRMESLQKAGRNPPIEEKVPFRGEEGKVDPNTAGYVALRNAGLSKRAANNLMKYREKGGRFTVAEDLSRIYGISEEDIRRLKSNFDFPEVEWSTPVQSSLPEESIELIELNAADTNALKNLTGIGSVLASRIIRYRSLIGGFYDLEQLNEVYGLTDSLVRTLAPALKIDTLLLRKMDLNRVTFKELQSHPYINAYQARSILKFRELSKGKINCKQLIDNYIIDSDIYRKLVHYLK
ncbi:MAG: helix-hairpin-helix domain-containing protein [Bacteroidales bacterium]|nr:helix-hairpin-helix domain-containing protein [Bacteroidales bacterium]